MTARGTSNSNQRGSSYHRRALSQWILKTFGDGTTCLCSFGCGTVLTIDTLTKDRYPLPGRKGGRYVKGNVRPACMTCNSHHGSVEAARERAEIKARRERKNQLARERRATKRALWHAINTAVPAPLPGADPAVLSLVTRAAGSDTIETART